MVNPKEEEFTEILDSLLKHNHRHGTPLSFKKLREALIIVKEAEENMTKPTSITLLQILCFSPPSLSMHKRNMQTGHMRDKLFRAFLQKRKNNSRDIRSNQQ